MRASQEISPGVVHSRYFPQITEMHDLLYGGR